MFKKSLIALSTAALLAGCGSTPKEKAETRSGIPNWVANPQGEVTEGLAATNCVPASSSFSLDQSEAMALARQALAQQIEVSIESMEETYQQRTRTAEGNTVSGSTFQSVSRQLTDQTLNGSRNARTDYETINGQNQLCTMVVVGEDSMRGLFDGILAASERPVGAQDQSVLWEQFRQQQALGAMDQALERRRNN